MNILRKISGFGFLLIALGLCTNGIVFLLAKEIMPYHQAAMGIPGFLTTGVSILLLLFSPFRKNERWADWAITIIALTEIVLMVARTINVADNTPANPPVIPLAGAAILVIVFFILTSVDYQKNKQSIK